MKVVGLITEYNPFHSGHLFHLQSSKQKSKADFVLVIMSGDFVQRGTPAFLDKYARTEMALLCGADAVIELPVRFSCASAEFFASGSVQLLNQLGIIDFLCFGSECGDLSQLQSISQHLEEESFAFQKAIQLYLKQGLSFPSARARAFLSLYPLKECSALLSEPNNILALEYLKALKQTKSNIVPITIPRQEAGYHDKNFYQHFASASALRETLQNDLPEKVRSYIPEPAFSVLKREYAASFPILPNDFSLPLYYKIRSDIEMGIPLSSYQDISFELEARMKKKLNQFTTFDAFAALLKTRQYTLTRIYRSLLHILLNIKKAAPVLPCYARLLGFRKSSLALLSAIKAHSAIPLITKTADAKTLLSSVSIPLSDSLDCSQKNGYALFRQDLFAADLYRKTQEQKFCVTLADEFTHPLIQIP